MFILANVETGFRTIIPPGPRRVVDVAETGLASGPAQRDRRARSPPFATGLNRAVFGREPSTASGVPETKKGFSADRNFGSQRQLHRHVAWEVRRRPGLHGGKYPQRAVPRQQSYRECGHGGDGRGGRHSWRGSRAPQQRWRANFRISRRGPRTARRWRSGREFAGRLWIRRCRSRRSSCG